LAIRWTWQSTQIASIPKPRFKVRFAVLTPTPGSRISSSCVSGTTPPNSSRIILLIERIVFAFVL